MQECICLYGANKEMAGKLESALEAEGILVKNRWPKEKNDNYLKSVPEGEVEEAHSIIIEKGLGNLNANYCPCSHTRVFITMLLNNDKKRLSGMK